MDYKCRKENYFLSFYNLIMLLSIIAFVNSSCSMAQDIGGKPREAREGETEPHTIHQDNSYCPDFEGIKTCCTEYQLSQLQNNFLAIESIFGGDGGCDICVINLKRFWCYFTCAPNQAEFIEIGNLTNYVIDGKEYELRDITFYLNDDTNCELFKSCKKTKFVAQVPSMGNAIGFTNFQGINAYSKIPVYVTMKIDNERGLKYDNDVCNLEVPSSQIVRGYKNISSCTCNTCEYSCNYDFDSSISFTNGMNITLIIVFYIFVFIATICLFFYKKYFGSKKSDYKYEEENDISPNSVES